jgi:outer membrane receptor protein involved in Fe transport
MKKNQLFSLRELVFAFLSMFCLAALCLGQTESAKIQGTVTDSTGAIVKGAALTVRSVGTGREIKIITEDDGSYVALSLSPGRYQIEVAAPGFKTTKQEVTLEVAQNANLDFQLEAGAVTETVTVTADIAQVDTSSSAIGNVVQGREITQLPLNGRNVLELARLSPGVTQGVVGGFATGAGGDAETYRNGNTGGAALSVNGQRTQANNFLLDGVDNNESLVNTINIFPSADAVQEFRVTTSVAAAEFGRGGGAIVNTVTKSGTQAYHGSGYLFIRNNALDARPAFFPSEIEFRRLPLFRRSQFGGTVGGPVYKKLFFFASYEGLRQFLPRATETATVPTAAFRNGDFSALSTVLRDPSTGLNICITGVNGCVNGNNTPYNRLDLLPAGRLNAAALAYLRAFPLPNNGTGTQSNYIVTRNELRHENVFDFRIDANITDDDQVFFRGNYGRYSQTVTSRLPDLPAGFGSGSNPTRSKGGVFGWNSSINSNMFNEMRIQANRLRYGYEPPFGDEPLSADLGIVNANRDASLGGGALIGGYNGQLEYTGDYGPYRVPQDTIQYVDSLSWVRGKHTLKFGGALVRRELQLFRPIAGKGYFRIYGNGDFDQCPGAPGAPSRALSGTTGYEQANLLIGFMCSYQIGVQNGNVGTTNFENAAFIQDDWRASSKLTLNLGLRYEYFTNPAERHARQSNFDLSTGRLVLASSASDTLTETDKNNYSPRIGFAYDIRGKGKSVVRGGFGIFYFLDRGGISNQLAQNAPFSGSSSYSYNDGYRITFSGQGPLGNNNNTLATLPLPLPPVDTSAAFLNNPLNADVIAVRPDNKTSSVMQYNIQYQHQLTDDTALSVGFVGTRGSNLVLYYNLNAAAYSAETSTPCPIAGRTLGSCYPGLGAVNVRDDPGKSSYNSLQLQLSRRMTKGWQYIASYTFSKTKDNGEGAFDNTSGGANYIEQYATSRLDFPHVFSFETVYELPWGRGRTYGGDMPKALDYLIGGWSLNAIFRAQSGSPFDVRLNGRLVNVTGDPYTGNSNKFPYLNRAAFSSTPTGFGNLQRNSLRSPANNQLNLGLSKDFKFTESTRLQFRAEAFNVFNRIQWGTPNTDLNNGSTTDGFGTIRSIVPYTNRQLQFGLRLEF